MLMAEALKFSKLMQVVGSCLLPEHRTSKHLVWLCGNICYRPSSNQRSRRLPMLMHGCLVGGATEPPKVTSCRARYLRAAGLAGWP